MRCEVSGPEVTVAQGSPVGPGHRRAARFDTGGWSVPEHWLRHLVYHVAIGNNNAHAKNVALLHLATGTQLFELYDAMPNLFQEGRIDHDLAFVVDGVFDHRRTSAESLINEADSWGVLPRGSAPSIVAETLSAIEAALEAVTPHPLASDGMPERIRWNVKRLLAGLEISTPKN